MGELELVRWEGPSKPKGSWEVRGGGHVLALGFGSMDGWDALRQAQAACAAKPWEERLREALEWFEIGRGWGA